ncbi:mechanosensitive ion channel family protein [Salinispirillum sp. LH 10-3-1]|uniref:Mechanosensing system component YbdG n=1 Tax=Salinispirillum sp. LH 10-3-1 TaxID=2952525 RepID=A0AB38YIS5_9GAMM
MQQSLNHWLDSYDIPNADLLSILGMLGLIVLISIIIHLMLHRGVLRLVDNLTRDKKRVWNAALFERKLFNRFAFTIQGIIIHVQAGLWLPTESVIRSGIQLVAQLWILGMALLTFFALLDTLLNLSMRSKVGRNLPLRGIFQGLKLAAAILISILVIALLIGKSPVILFSGLGAMTAVLLLVFKDPILGLVAGIQLSANKMLAVGDWLEMPKYGADGDVIDITLTTVKVQNWDRTITTVPTYALISDSFKNWRGMTDSGGRRIKRAIRIDGTSVHFLTEEELTRLRKAKLLSGYIEGKIKDIEADNAASGVDSSSPVNGRRLTNLGTFRAYLTAYLKANKRIHADMIQMVRQLEPDSNGIPLEIYAFSNQIGWVEYEGIQADLFDHIFAVLPEFGLRLHQTPTGSDFQRLMSQ